MWLDRLIFRVLDRCCVRCGTSCADSLCGACRGLAIAQESSVATLPVRSLGPYDEPLASFVRGLKYEERTYRAAALGAALAEVFPLSWRDAVLVPVPLHPERLVERGYNQSALLARALSRNAHLRVRFDWLERTRNTDRQARANRDARLLNLVGAFCAAPSVENQRVVLLDDVVTTGSTIDACSRALSERGASVLGVVCCASARFDSSPMSPRARIR